MIIEEIFRYMEAGQYWARLKPVGLVQLVMVSVGSGMGADSWWNFKCQVWARGTPYGEEQDHCYLGPGNNDFTYLWFRKELTPDEKSSKPNYRIGDVWVTDTSELFFVGPDTTDKVLVIHSDAFISETEISLAHLYQPGPEGSPAEGLNRLQRIGQDSP